MTSILQFADVHFGAEDPAAIAAASATVRELSPDLVLICGDITQTGSKEEYDAAEEWVAGFQVPVVATPGNHDAPYFNPIKRVADPYGRFEAHILPHCVPYFVDAHVVVLPYNSSRAIQAKLDWSVGEIDLEELDGVIARFQELGPDRLHLFACHHPLIYPPESPLDKTTGNGPEALERLSDANCDAVLTGHIHIPFVKDREPGETGLLSIGAGTLSTRRRGVEPSFNHIEVDGSAMTVTAVDLMEGDLVRRASWTKGREAFT